MVGVLCFVVKNILLVKIILLELFFRINNCKTIQHAIFSILLYNKRFTTIKSIKTIKQYKYFNRKEKTNKEKYFCNTLFKFNHKKILSRIRSIGKVLESSKHSTSRFR